MKPLLVLLILLFIASIFGNTQALFPIAKNSINHLNYIDARKHYFPLNASTKENAETKEKIDTTALFPVMQKKKGINWIGNCRCISSADLSPENFTLRGGSMNEIDGDFMCLTSFLSFPMEKQGRLT